MRKKGNFHRERSSGKGISEMKIKITKQEYELLLKVFYIADWILNAFKEGIENDRYKKLEQKILACAKDFGLENFVRWDPGFQEYDYTGEFEEKSPVMEIIEEYEGDNFWNELINRLCIRDLIEKYGEEALLEMDIRTRLEKEEELRAKYSAEFEENGRKNIKIV